MKSFSVPGKGDLTEDAEEMASAVCRGQVSDGGEGAILLSN